VSDELANKLARASEHIDAGFGARDVEPGLAALEQRIAGRRRLKYAALGLSAAAGLVLVSIPWHAREPVQLAAAPVVAGPLRTLTTRDGSVASPFDAQTLLAVTHDAADEVTIDLQRGSGHFEVTSNPKRRYRVRAGEVEVEVLGTAFDVERRAGGARVRVNHGVVRVGWPSGGATLRAGESGVYPPPAPATEVIPAQPTQIATPEPAAQQAKRVPREREQAWRDLARAGKHQEAFGSLGKQPVEDLAGLLLAADAARLSGHPREAARYLEHLVQRYPQSPSAPLAAFTLGRLALYELKQPALAAGSFARAYTLDPKGPMAEDALANEAEAYHRAGDAQRTKSAAERYLARFPGGARRKELAGYAAP
jgi:transmembrane sensor